MASNAWSRYINPSTAFVDGLTELGYKMNFTDLHAAIGRVQLKRFESMAGQRLRLAKHYEARLKALGDRVTFQQDAFIETHARHLLVGLFDPAKTGMSRDSLLVALRARNIGASIHYQPLHTMPLYHPYLRGELPMTDRLAQQIMTLPISARMSVDDVDYITQHLIELILSRS
jgi:dTDP-4-amino-4,6-dideoxygalactose transaminase